MLHRLLDPRPGGQPVGAFDTDLFGHWRSEGADFLDVLLRGIADDPGLRTTTLASRLARHPPTRRLELPESSWGSRQGPRELARTRDATDLADASGRGSHVTAHLGAFDRRTRPA